MKKYFDIFYVGILGNKIADKLAKPSTALNSTQFHSTLYTLSQTYKAINNSKNAQYYKVLEASVSYALKSSFNNVPNKERMIIVVKLGTLCFNQYLFKSTNIPRNTALTVQPSPTQYSTSFCSAPTTT